MTLTKNKQDGLALVTWLILIFLAAGLLLAAYIWAMMKWSNASGERADWV